MWSAEQGRPVQRGLHASPSHHDRLRLQLDDVHRQLTYTREIADFYRTHIRCLQISPRTTWRSPIAICSAQHRHLKSHWPPLVIISVDRRLPHIESPLLMLPPWSSFNNAAWIPVQAGLDPLHMTARVQ